MLHTVVYSRPKKKNKQHHITILYMHWAKN